MNGLGIIACGAGLHDGLNPCIFMTCAVFIIHGLWLARSFLRIVWLRIFFVLAYASSFLEFNFGPAQILVFRKEFVLAAKILYFALGIWAFILGILFFKDWFLIRVRHEEHRGLPAEKMTGQEIKFFTARGLALRLVTVMLAVLLSALATLGPVNNYIMVLGNLGILKGQWQSVMPFLAGYVFFSMWPLWFVWAFLSIKNLRPSLVKIVCASVFFTASSCIIFIFKK